MSHLLKHLQQVITCSVFWKKFITSVLFFPIITEQQQALIQAVVFKLTDLAFDQCVPKPSSSLSSSEQSCISSVVGKYVETSQLIVGRFSAAADQQR